MHDCPHRPMAALSLFEECETEASTAATGEATSGLLAASSLFEGFAPEIGPIELQLPDPDSSAPQSSQRKRKQSGQSPKELTAKQKSIAKARRTRWVNHAPSADTMDKPIDNSNESVVIAGKVASALFSSDSLRLGEAAAASQLGCSRYNVRNNIQLLSSAACDSANALSENMIRSLCCNSSVQPLLYLAIREYDETPVTLRIASEPNISDTGDTGTGWKTKQTCKLLVTHNRWACLLSSNLPDSTISFLCLESYLPTRLQVIQSNTGSLIGRALQESISSNCDTAARSSFAMSCDVICSDSYAANFVGERLLKESRGQHDQSGAFHFSCALVLHLVDLVC